MRFENQPESSNIEDRRSAGGVRAGAGRSPFGGMRLPIPTGGRGGLSIGGILLLLAVLYFSGGFGGMFGGGGASAGASQAAGSPARPGEEQLRSFVAKVLATTEECWGDLFPRAFGRPYEPPTLVLFRDGVESACGVQGSSVGPFYCPGDMRVYIDLSFLDEMGRTLGAAGDFAQAYVVAHEVGHHVQNLLGTNRRVAAARGREAEQNRQSVMLELQADYFAGVWASYVDRNLKGRAELEVGDYEEAIRAARAVGDDVLQKRASGRVVPENFTHGTAEQRSKWFRLGFESGDPKAHDPFRDER